MAINANTQTYTIHRPVLKVLGLGGGGGNAVNRMIELGIKGVEFIAANTDHQDLASNLAPTKIRLGPKLTRGLGAGGDPRVGKAAAEESAAEIRAALTGADMVFLAAGMGGGTGTGSIQVAGRIAKELGAVTIAVVTTPFGFEMGRRQVNASEGLAALHPNTNTLIAIPNDRLLYAWPQDISLETAFRLADDVLRQAVQGISELVTSPGVINVDFAHIRSVMKLGGGALMAIGHGSGEGKALDAVNQALNHPLLESICLTNAAGIIVNFTGGSDLSLYDVGEALAHIHDLSRPDVDVILGFDKKFCQDQNRGSLRLKNYRLATKSRHQHRISFCSKTRSIWLQYQSKTKLLLEIWIYLPSCAAAHATVQVKLLQKIMEHAMDKKLVNKITKTVYRKFPELKGSSPRIKQSKSPVNEEYVLVYKAHTTDIRGNQLPRSVRVVANAKGKIQRISTSR
jgi:cell division protein FtsZ